MFDKKTIRDIDLQGKRVLVRVDFNVPIKNGLVGDDTRIRAALPTLEYLIGHQAILILCSHLGRPDGSPDVKYSLKPVAEHLSQLLSKPVGFADDCIGAITTSKVAALKPGDILVLENTRFHAGETKNDADMARQLAALADIFVNDAFGSAHRAHASTEGVAHFLPAVAGFLMEKEIQYLGDVISAPEKPFVAILGGAKVSDKIGVIRNLSAKADVILIGGGMANTFFKAEGYPVGESLVEDEALDQAREFLKIGKTQIRLPVDVKIADKFAEDAAWKLMPTGPIPNGWMILDIGPETVIAYAKVIKKAKTVIWNGPMGVFEFPEFAKGTFGVAQAIANSQATSIIGGGDSVAAIQQSGLAGKISHISTGGGASLEMLEGLSLPGVTILLDK
ncbi:MAG: phosphoglycerate kinase [Chloroflexi bacterium GWB2_49_20]|nr:MAG: phosphoglycerate kinase [Chloroflexi bacterium GWB2_49_20]OGN78115.1 MAG: phosphoglycerate kinase [Chloroflexi bacterium GWC2_49_37]OGN85152.1 MAG: phosphoglycerate kinase [Chloroflexi bacterium GWD2_49_16]